MLEKNVTSEYRDVELVGNVTYGEGDICKIVDNSMILDVIGKLQHSVL